MIFRKNECTQEEQVRDTIVCDKAHQSEVLTSCLLSCDKCQSFLVEESPGEELRATEFFLEELSLAAGQVQRQPLPGFAFHVPVVQNHHCTRLGIAYSATLHLIPNVIKAIFFTAVTPFPDLHLIFNKSGRGCLKKKELHFRGIQADSGLHLERSRCRN